MKDSEIKKTVLVELKEKRKTTAQMQSLESPGGPPHMALQRVLDSMDKNIKRLEEEIADLES